MLHVMFNIFEKTGEEIKDFDSRGIYIVGKPKSENEHNIQKGERGGYYFSQKDLLDSIDLACASKYKKGIWDDEGQRKTFLNIVNFYRDVMKMKININVANYIFEPRSLAYTWVVWLFDRMFKLWASIHGYDDQIDEMAHDLATYGSVVVKKLDKCTERVPLRSLRNTQTAKSLYKAAAYGGYVLIENEFHYNEMDEYPDWDLEDLDKDGTFQVFERYALVPKGLIDGWEGMTDLQISQYKPKKDEEMVCAMAMLILEGAGTKSFGSKLVYLQEIDEDTFPLEECHVEKRDGRWLGVGEVEKQLEAQISRNLNANLRRRGILWATKKIFYSDDDNIQQNLVMEVKDGEVLKLGKGRTAGQLNTNNQHTGDIANDEKSWDENSRQNAFAFEVATGEALPSNTPFRLGVILQQSVAQHFTLVRETFSNFLIRCFFDQLVPLFQKDYKIEHEAIVSMGESGVENLKEEIITYHTNLRIWDGIMGDKRPDPAMVREQVAEEFARNQYAFISVPSKYYKDAEYYMKLNLVDDIGPELADLTSLYQAMVQKGDPRADNVLKMIFAKRGKNLDSVLGPAPKAAAPGMPPVDAPASDSPGPIPAPAPAKVA